MSAAAVPCCLVRHGVIVCVRVLFLPTPLAALRATAKNLQKSVCDITYSSAEQKNEAGRLSFAPIIGAYGHPAEKAVVKQRHQLSRKAHGHRGSWQVTDRLKNKAISKALSDDIYLHFPLARGG